ncbi:2-hydroxyacid dehydrogenase [Melioribacteraceae bacterium 4301-Me]|uniref:2-hydroxyacid dehydrogenase n=1 Tax=Pyranulibacter aquaticus TaxID=3163344 RepID=UPI003599D407
MKVLITRKIPEIAEHLLLKHKFEVDVYQQDQPIPRKILLEKSKNVDGIISLLTEKIDKEFIDNLTNCKVIANYAVGYNNIDVEYAKKKGIIVTNTPGILTDSTADLTLGLILACVRHIVVSDRFTRAGKFKGWKPKLFLGFELRNKIAGIIGAGRIGTEVAKRLTSFGTKVIYFDKTRNPYIEKYASAKRVSLNVLLKKSDIISIHLPLTESTYHLLNRNNLKLARPNAIIVNTARGEIVDEKALIEMLVKRKIFAAGFDVYENEPQIKHELFRLDNVVLLPHIGSATFEARSKMAELAAKNVIAVLKGKKALTPV